MNYHLNINPKAPSILIYSTRWNTWTEWNFVGCRVVFMWGFFFQTELNDCIYICVCVYILNECPWICYLPKIFAIYSSLLVDGTTIPKLLSTVSSLCQRGGLYTSTAGVSISTRVDIDESLQIKWNVKKNLLKQVWTICTSTKKTLFQQISKT